MSLQEDSAEKLRHPVVRGVVGLAGVQAVQVLVPLLTLPYLTRVLGPAGWGEVAAALALANLAATLPEYGFSVSASRALAQQAGQTGAARALVSGVVAAKAVLAVGAVAVVLALQLFERAALGSGVLVAGACLIAAGHGLWMAWFFEGAERAPAFFRVVVVARLGYAALVLLLIRAPADGALVPLLYGLSGIAAALLALRYMPWRSRVAPSAVWEVLRAGRAGFAQRVLVMVYAAGNVFWLSLMAPPAVVGGYGVAEQAARAACLALVPISRALYPRYSRAATTGAQEGWMRFTLPAMAGVGAVLAVVTFAAAGLLPLVFGSDYAAFVPVLRLLAPLPLLVALSQYWTVQNLMARGRDRAVVVLFGMGAAVDLALAVALVPRFGALGMAGALLAAETVVTLGSGIVAHRTRPHPDRHV